MLLVYTPKEVQQKYRHALRMQSDNFVSFDFYFGFHQIGFGELDIHNKDISWLRFYPFVYPQGVLFKEMGLGTLATIIPLVDLVKAGRLDERYNYRFDRGTLSEDRKAHYSAMGIDYGRKRLPLDEYLDTCIHYAKSKGFKLKNPL